MAGVARYGNAPRQVNPGDGEIPEPLGYEVFNFLFAAARCNKAWLGNQRFDLLLIAGEPEEQIQLIPPFQSLLVNGALGSTGLCRVVLEFFAGHAIPTLLATFHHIAIGFDPLEKLLHHLPMAGIGCANKAIIADLPLVP